MSRMNLWGLAVVVGFAVCAFSAAVASAAPPEFQNKNGMLPEKKGFKISGSTSVLATSRAEVTITCTSVRGSGKIATGKTVENVSLTFEGCTATAGTTSCGSAQSGTTAGVIKTETLKGELGVSVESETSVSLELEPQGFVTVFMKIKFEKESLSCLGGEVTHKVIAEMKPAFTLTKTGEWVFAWRTEIIGGKEIKRQLIEKFHYEKRKGTETGDEENVHLEAFGFASALLSTEKITYEEEVQIT